MERNNSLDKNNKPSKWPKLLKVISLLKNLSEKKDIKFEGSLFSKDQNITLPKEKFDDIKEALVYLNRQKRILMETIKERGPRLGVKLSPEENNKLEEGFCVTCEDGKCKKSFDKQNEHVVAKCSSCNAIYHQYSGYGSWYLQSQVEGDN